MRKHLQALVGFVLLILFVAAGVYLVFDLGGNAPQRETEDRPIVATVDIASQSTPIAPFAGVNPAIVDTLLDDNPIDSPGFFSSADVPPIGEYLPRIGEAGVIFEFPEPDVPLPEVDPLAPPTTNELDGITSLTIESDSAGAVDLLEYAGDGCAPAGLPVSGILTQRYHRRHSGIDIGVPVTTPVRTTHSGEVIFAGWSTYGYGYLVIVENDIFITYYAHLSNFNVRVGDQVGAGSIVAWSGNTGNSTGPHLHYEVRINDTPVDPLTFEQRGYLSC